MRRHIGIIVLASAAALLLTAPPAAAAGPGSYAVTQTHNVPFTTLTTNNLVSGSVYNAVYYMSTTSTRINRLPFPLHLYNSTYRSIAISTNGNIQPGTAPTVVSAIWNQRCLPNAAFGRTALMAFYFADSLGFSSDYGQGIFTRTKGKAPHRTFIVSWQKGYEFVSAPTTVNVQMIFTEGSQTVRYVYGPITSQYLVVAGLQSKDQTSSTQVHCGEFTPFPGSAGLQLTFTHLN
jgi:hypothetical protein